MYLRLMNRRAFVERSNNLYCFRVWQNFWRRGRLLSDFNEIQKNIKIHEENTAWNDRSATFDATWRRHMREAAALEYAADAYIADEVPTPDQMFSDTDDGF
jgi:hypothetical protein